MQKLLLRTKMARLGGTIICKFLERLSKTDLLILDDFGLTHLEQQQCLVLMEIIEDRHARASTIIASQLPIASWYDMIGEETIAAAILDRLVLSSYRIELRGESLRKNSKFVSPSDAVKQNLSQGGSITGISNGGHWGISWTSPSQRMPAGSEGTADWPTCT